MHANDTGARTHTHYQSHTAYLLKRSQMRLLTWATFVAWAASVVYAIDFQRVGVQLDGSEVPEALRGMYQNQIIMEEGKLFSVSKPEIDDDLLDLDLGSSDEEADEPRTPQW